MTTTFYDETLPKTFPQSMWIGNSLLEKQFSQANSYYLEFQKKPSLLHAVIFQAYMFFGTHFLQASKVFVNSEEHLSASSAQAHPL